MRRLAGLLESAIIVATVVLLVCCSSSDPYTLGDVALEYSADICVALDRCNGTDTAVTCTEELTVRACDAADCSAETPEAAAREALDRCSDALLTLDEAGCADLEANELPAACDEVRALGR